MSRPVAVLIASVALLIAAPSAEAAFPGENGKIAFASNRDGDFEIYVMNPDGSGQTPLTSNAIHDGYPAWSPDGSRIAFERQRDSDPLSREIWVMNADGTGQSLLTSHPGISRGDPAWSPDGTRIVFRNGFGLGVINADGTGFYELTANVDPIDFGDIDKQPAWSPDNTTILFSRERCCEGNELLWAVRPDGTVSRRVTNDVISGEGRTLDTSPNWAPGGPRFAFRRDADPEFEGEPGLLIATEANPNDFAFLTGAGSQPAWSPDATRIVYSNGDIEVMPASGGTAVNLAAAGLNREPDWQPLTVNAYVRPKAASPQQISLVPAYRQCTAANRTHGPPLGFSSCNPPEQASTQLTVGTFDANSAAANSAAYVRLAWVGEIPIDPNNGDQSDVSIRASITDVRNADLTDYTGNLTVKIGLRITDKDNTPHPGGPGAATTQDHAYSFSIPCTATGSSSIGATCSLFTTADTLVPGSVLERKRAIWQVDRVAVHDSANAPFLTQGIFVP